MQLVTLAAVLLQMDMSIACSSECSSDSSCQQFLGHLEYPMDDEIAAPGHGQLQYPTAWSDGQEFAGLAKQGKCSKHLRPHGEVAHSLRQNQYLCHSHIDCQPK